MASAVLSATSRSTVGKGAARSLRRDGQIPAIIYGHARAPQNLAVPARELGKLLQHIASGSTVVELSFDGRMSRTLIREIQRHPFKDQILHVDFQELVAGEAITVSIPLRLVGVPEGVRLSGGVLDQIMRELEIEVDPANIPNHIDVDVTSVQIGHPVHVRDIVLPEGVTVLDDADATVCVVAVPKVAVEETPTAEAADAAAEPEVIRKAKADGDEEGDKAEKDKK
jgi:large subunit ribosomal protein L25